MGKKSTPEGLGPCGITLPDRELINKARALVNSDGGINCFRMMSALENPDIRVLSARAFRVETPTVIASPFVSIELQIGSYIVSTPLTAAEIVSNEVFEAWFARPGEL